MEQKIDYKRLAEILLPAVTEALKVIAAGTENKIDDQVAAVLDQIADAIYEKKEIEG